MLNIRPFSLEDKEDYMQMSYEFYNSDAAISCIPKEEFQKNFQEVMKHSPFLKGYILEYDGQTAGYLLLSFCWYSEFCGMIVNLEEISVLESFQGKKIGTSVLGWIEDQFRECKAIRLEVCSKNPRAAKLYEKIGYEYMEYRYMIKKLQ